MSKKRYKSTHFWEDNYVINLDPLEKLLFGYLLDNPMVSILGVYEFHPRRVAFETGIDTDMVNKMLARFQRDGKIAIIEDSYICLLNRPKHQSTGGKIDNPTAKGIIREFQELPARIQKQVPRVFYESAQQHWGNAMLEKWQVVLGDISETEVDEGSTMGHNRPMQVPMEEPEDSLLKPNGLTLTLPNGITAQQSAEVSTENTQQDQENNPRSIANTFEALKAIIQPTAKGGAATTKLLEKALKRVSHDELVAAARSFVAMYQRNTWRDPQYKTIQQFLSSDKDRVFRYEIHLERSSEQVNNTPAKVVRRFGGTA